MFEQNVWGLSKATVAESAVGVQDFFRTQYVLKSMGMPRYTMEMIRVLRRLWGTDQRRFLLLAALIVALGTALRLSAFTARSLWFDEAFSWRLIAFFPSAEFFTRAAADVHPILYYVLLWFWMLPITSRNPETVLFALRLFSVAGACVTIAAMIAAGRVLFRSRAVGLTAGLFTALNAFQLQYAWEARMYTLGTALVPLAMVTLHRTLTARTHRKAWQSGTALGLSLGALLQVHYYTLFTWLSLGAVKLFVLVRRLWNNTRQTLRSPAAQAAEAGFWGSAVLFLPWLPVFLAQAQRVEGAYWIPRLAAWSIPATIARLFWGGVIDISNSWAVTASVAAALLVIIALWRGRTLGDLLAAAGFVGPLALSTLVSLRTSVYLDRYFLFASLGLLLLAARAISFLPRDLRRGAVIIASVLSIVSLTRFMTSLDFPHQRGARAAAAFVAARAISGETVLVSSPFAYFPMSFHLGCSETGNDCADGLSVRLAVDDPNLAHFAGAPILQPGEAVRPSDVFFAVTRPRVWVVDTTGFGGSELAVPASYQRRSERRFVEPFRFQGELVVREYAPSPLDTPLPH